MDDVLMHYGTPHQGSESHSGRYPWGSGENGYQRYGDFYSRYNNLKKQGFTEKEIAEKLGCVNRWGEASTTILRARYSNAKAEKRAVDRATAMQYKEQGLNISAIGREMGINESSVRSLLDEAKADRNDLTRSTAKLLGKFVDEKKFVDIGPGAELELNVSRTRLKNAIALLEEDGYQVGSVYIDQMGTNHKTTISVLYPPGVDYKTLLDNKYNIVEIGQSKVYNEDGTIGKLGLEKGLANVDPSRVKILYNEEGGIKKDGLIELRRGVDDISLGNAKYAQVRIAVNGTHYIKGMACYSDNLPDGVDILFNTNKHLGTPMLGDKDNSVLKPLKNDPDNPFGATIKGEDSLIKAQRYYTDKKTGERKLSAINVVNEEGDWNEWSRNLPSQFLSKQYLPLAKKQLALAAADKKAEFDEICSLTNPTIKKKLLESFSDDCDASAVHLKAAALPRQKTHVLLPFTDLKDNEIYAPNYREGEQVCLVRFPHGGIFEIPTLTVRNKGTVASKIIKNAVDAVGINSKVAEQLSGADFDGDTALVIPVGSKVKVRTSDPLDGLKGFDPKERYPYYDGMKVMAERTKQIEMGKVTNLITDMTLKGATEPELARAVRHSMTIIDCVKHRLDYKTSYEENGIAELKQKYQNGGGAATLISRAKNSMRVPVRKVRTGINSMNTDPETGERIWTETGETYTKTKVLKDGTVKTKTVVRTEEIPKMEGTNNAFTLTSGGSEKNPGTPMEAAYATFANQMKSLGNQARKEYLATEPLKYNPEAKKKYAKEVSELNAALNVSLKNAPRERQAQLLANRTVSEKVKNNPDYYDEDDHLKKLKGQALNSARSIVGAKKELINISDRQWEAIQAGAISDHKLAAILDNTDIDILKQRATPRATNTVSPGKEAKIRAMLNSGYYTTAEIAEATGVSTSTVSRMSK